MKEDPMNKRIGKFACGLTAFALMCGHAAMGQGLGGLLQKAKDKTGQTQAGSSSAPTASAAGMGGIQMQDGHPLKPTEAGTTPAKQRAYVKAAMADPDAIHSPDSSVVAWKTGTQTCHFSPVFSADDLFLNDDEVKPFSDGYMDTVKNVMSDLGPNCKSTRASDLMAVLPKIKEIHLTASPAGVKGADPNSETRGWTFTFNKATGLLTLSIPKDGVVDLGMDNTLTIWLIKNIK